MAPNPGALITHMNLMTTARTASLLATAALALLPACDFDSELAPRVALDVAVDGAGVTTHTNDLGYIVDLSRCRVAIDTLEFTTDGEMHARAQRTVLDSLMDLAIPTAYAHPGHEAGGEIVGELPGIFVFDWRDDGQVLGQATMFATQYSGANFTFARATADDGILPDDPILGHTFDIAGEATYEGQTVTFEVQLDQDEDRRVVGLPLDLYVDDGSDEVLALSLHLQDPFEADTAFDGIDFLALDEDGDGHVVLEPDTEAYNRLRRNLQAHDHYAVEIR